MIFKEKFSTDGLSFGLAEDWDSTYFVGLERKFRFDTSNSVRLLYCKFKWFFMRFIMKTDSYSPLETALKWQERWKENDVFKTEFSPERPSFYGYEYPPFPSGSLHMGHVRNYIIGDTLARYKRLCGYNVLYCQAYDSLGLPVEDAAVASGKSPAEWLDECISIMTEELLKLGLSYDRSRFFSYHEPDYYKWTQWIFLKLYEAGAVYQAENWSDWCGHCQTALAYEQVNAGKCWRCGGTVSKKLLKEWYIDVQSIAADLVAGLDKHDFPEKAKALQKSWIGPSNGLFVSFALEQQDGEAETSLSAIEIFTNRAAVIYGTTYIGLAPEHPLIATLLEGHSDKDAILSEVRQMCTVPRVERMKTPEARGIFLNHHCLHPLSGDRLPVYVVPYIQGDIGTGAAIGCPAHDKNAFRFADTMGLEVKPVILPEGGLPLAPGQCYTGKGILQDSGPFDGQDTVSAEKTVTDHLIASGAARQGETYRVRDWCISRQRYWSAPIPIVYCDTCGTVPVPEDQLPVLLPTEGVNMDTTGNPLTMHEPFVKTHCPSCGAEARRETSTLDTFVNSSWSYLRYCNPDYKDGMYDPEAVDRWVPCDLDIGGTENITVANFYFRVILTWLNRLGFVSKTEPFKSSIFHGMVLKDGLKMSKSLGNIVRPSELIGRHGVDAVRFQSMWAARPSSDYNWSDEKASMSQRFLANVWSTGSDIIALIQTDNPVELDRGSLTKAEKKFEQNFLFGARKIKRAYDTYELQAVCNNLQLIWEKTQKFIGQGERQLSTNGRELARRALHDFLIMLNPIAPHLTEELWRRFGHREMLAERPHWQESTTLQEQNP